MGQGQEIENSADLFILSPVKQEIRGLKVRGLCTNM